MSARAFRDACRQAGLHCVSQEVINWIGRGAKADRHRLPGERVPLTDCLSRFARPLPGQAGEPTRVYVNRHFVDEWRQLVLLARVYGPLSGDDSSGAAAPHLAAEPTTAHRHGLPAAAHAMRRRLGEAVEHVTSRVKEEAAGRALQRREPIARRIARGLCPDCATPLSRVGDGLVCRRCDAVFVM
jgi:hypothetical protein